MNRHPTLIDFALAAILAIVLIVGAFQIGAWAYHACRAFARWVFP